MCYRTYKAEKMPKTDMRMRKRLRESCGLTENWREHRNEGFETVWKLLKSTERTEER